MKNFVSKLRALIIGTFKTSLKEDTKVNTFELGVVTFRTLQPEEAHPFEQQECNIRATFRSSRPEEDYLLEQEVSTFRTLKP